MHFRVLPNRISHAASFYACAVGGVIQFFAYTPGIVLIQLGERLKSQPSFSQMIGLHYPHFCLKLKHLLDCLSMRELIIVIAGFFLACLFCERQLTAVRYLANSQHYVYNCLPKNKKLFFYDYVYLNFSVLFKEKLVHIVILRRKGIITSSFH